MERPSGLARVQLESAKQTSAFASTWVDAFVSVELDALA
jgi:hypothetical protein